MYKLLIISVLTFILLSGCGPVNRTADEGDRVLPEAAEGNSLDPGRSPDPKPKFGQEIPPEPIHQQVAVYPRQARDLGITGCVIIQAYVDDIGRVKEAKALNCDRPGFGFEESALKAAYKFRYKPATQNGTAIGVWITYKVQFKTI